MSATLTAGGTMFIFTPYIPTQGQGTPINFRANIINISDDYAPTWNQYNDMGRGDPKVMYGSYSRSISVDFMTVALNRGEEQIWLKALNSLTDMTKPYYRRGVGYNGVYAKMRIGKLISEIGYIENVNITVDNESPWIKDVPIYISCSVTFKVLGEKKPSYKKSYGNLGGKEFGNGNLPGGVART